MRRKYLYEAGSAGSVIVGNCSCLELLLEDVSVSIYSSESCRVSARTVVESWVE